MKTSVTFNKGLALIGFRTTGPYILVNLISRIETRFTSTQHTYLLDKEGKTKVIIVSEELSSLGHV